ncbi:MAG TPA: GNAT family protein [Xanthomonadaceae bacterium]|nr:GNAT family protein [Xanthomonadaceae bacterium]
MTVQIETADSTRVDIAAALAALAAPPTLHGSRVRLRAPRADDADALFALFSDPAVMRYWSRPPMTERAEAEAQLARWADGFASRGGISWAITPGGTDEAIGSCSLFRIDPDHRRAEIGYALRADQWGRGIAREATSLLLDWGFRTLGLHRVEADIDPRNAASRGLLLRLGFASEGLLRERYFVAGEVTDTELFGLLARDWRGQRAR